MKKLLRGGIAALAAALIAAQFVQPERTNPPADPAASFEAVAKPHPEISAMVGRACRDCHSNETSWPWYSRISPVSWLVARDVKVGRAKLNFSQWNIYAPEMTRIKLAVMCEEVRKGEMPPPYYRPMHPNAKVTPSEVSAVCAAPVASR
ncbi:MAG: heme-binding domain-containing protein [Bryobacteraceae bacterium]